MVLAGEQVAERLERLAFGALRQFFRAPGLANLAGRAVTIAFGKKGSREREATLGARRLIADKTANGGGVAPLLPQPRLRPPAHLAHDRPMRVVGNERRVAIDIRVSIRMAQQEPFDQLLRRGIAEGFFYG